MVNESATERMIRELREENARLQEALRRGDIDGTVASQVLFIVTAANIYRSRSTSSIGWAPLSTGRSLNSQTIFDPLRPAIIASRQQLNGEGGRRG